MNHLELLSKRVIYSQKKENGYGGGEVMEAVGVWRRPWEFRVYGSCNKTTAIVGGEGEEEAYMVAHVVLGSWMPSTTRLR